MFFGTFYHNLDNKGRMVIPSKFRKSMGEASRVYMLEGFEGCLSVYPEEHFETLTQSLTQLKFTNSNDRAYVRHILSSIVEMEVDSHNRLSLPKAILDQFQISSDISIVGVGDHFEIWNKDTFESYRKQTSHDLSTIANNLSGGHHE